MSDDKRLVYTMVNTLDVEKAKEIVSMAVKYGTDGIWIGSALLYSCGLLRIVPAIREIAGDKLVVADIKVHDGGAFFPVKAKEFGADYCTISTRSNYGCCREGVRAQYASGVKIIGDLCTVPEEDIPHYVAELQNIGIAEVCVHYTYDESKYFGLLRRSWDGVRAAKGVAHIPVGCVARSFTEIHNAMYEGADWIAIAGEIVDNSVENGFEDMKKAIEMVHDYKTVEQLV